MKRLFLVLTVVLAGLNGLAQVTMADVFRAMPEKEARLLTNNDRMDLLDFVASNMTARVANRLDEKSTLDKLTDDYLHLTVTKISTMEMKLLPLKDTLQAVLVVKTVAGPAKDSVIKLFSTDWSEELDVNQYLYFALPLLWK
ncbi:MAG: DUF3256 family protein [Bacteroidaceae bacterium]|nr:DUF3256 family protein [Bacteroidaceae bacterium]